MRLSREKLVRLSHVVTDLLVASDDVEFVEDRATIRQNIVDILTALLKEEEQVDAQVRQKIGSQKKEIHYLPADVTLAKSLKGVTASAAWYPAAIVSAIEGGEWTHVTVDLSTRKVVDVWSAPHSVVPPQP
jgi:hypothetical protein